MNLKKGGIVKSINTAGARLHGYTVRISQCHGVSAVRRIKGQFTKGCFSFKTQGTVSVRNRMITNENDLSTDGVCSDDELSINLLEDASNSPTGLLAESASKAVAAPSMKDMTKEELIRSLEEMSRKFYHEKRMANKSRTVRILFVKNVLPEERLRLNSFFSEIYRNIYPKEGTTGGE